MSVKFTQLPLAVTPLDGSEIACLVQNGLSVQSPVSSFAVFLLFTPEGSFVAAAGNNNNVGLAGARLLIVDTAAGPVTITGFEGGAAGYPLVINNNGANDITLPLNSVLSDPDNRLIGIAEMTIPPGASQFFLYSGVLSRWVMV